MWWRRKATIARQRYARDLVWNGLAAGKEPNAILDDLILAGADVVGAIQIYVWFRWKRYPRWIRWSSAFGFVQSRPQALDWLRLWLFIGVLLSALAVMSFVNPAVEFGAYGPEFGIAAGLVFGRVVWRWRAIGWIDRHGSWLYAGWTPRQLRELAREAAKAVGVAPTDGDSQRQLQ